MPLSVEIAGEDEDLPGEGRRGVVVVRPRLISMMWPAKFCGRGLAEIGLLAASRWLLLVQTR